MLLSYVIIVNESITVKKRLVAVADFINAYQVNATAQFEPPFPLFKRRGWKFSNLALLD